MKQSTYTISESLINSFDKKILSLPLDQKAIDYNIARLKNKLRNIKTSISIRTNQNFINSSLYKNTQKYGQELHISNIDNIFKFPQINHSDPSFFKSIFALKLSCLNEIQRATENLLPIILIMPETIDYNSIELMLTVLKKYFSKNQIIMITKNNFHFYKMGFREIIIKKFKSQY